MSRACIEFSQEELEAICRRRAVERLALFRGRRVDLVDAKRLKPRLKKYVMENVDELYAAPDATRVST